MYYTSRQEQKPPTVNIMTYVNGPLTPEEEAYNKDLDRWFKKRGRDIIIEVAKGIPDEEIEARSQSTMPRMPIRKTAKISSFLARIGL